MVQAGGDKEFFKETIDEDPGDPGIFIKPVRAEMPWVIKGQIRKGDGVEDNHRRHRHQRQLGAAAYDSAPQLNGRDFSTHAIVQPRISPENAHIHHHKAQQLGLPGAIIFTVNFSASPWVCSSRVVGAET